MPTKSKVCAHPLLRQETCRVGELPRQIIVNHIIQAPFGERLILADKGYSRLQTMPICRRCKRRTKRRAARWPKPYIALHEDFRRGAVAASAVKAIRVCREVSRCWPAGPFLPSPRRKSRGFRFSVAQIRHSARCYGENILRAHRLFGENRNRS